MKTDVRSPRLRTALLAALLFAGPSIRAADDAPAVSPAEALAAITVPDGFTVERVAGPPLVERPMLASFDDRGRLYVADSAGVNLRGDELSKNPPHRIRCLEDTDGDGQFDKSTVFADKLVFPQGVLWHAGSVYTSSPPSFWKLTDTDGDGVADRREELVTGFANTGVADDMHGASLGPDGRIYWFAGRFPHEIRRPGGPVIHQGTAPLLLRCKPDGSDVEVVCGTQGNAVGVVFTPEGDMFACGTFLAPDSMGAGLRDAIIHCIDGGEYPVRDRVLNEHKRTGELLPPLTHLGVAAAADLEIYRSDVFGKEYTGNLFSASFNFHKVWRHVLERDGATHRCKNEDFLVSKNGDFHPTDVLEDADGSLLVVDTGGWFRLGCPTSQISKAQVLGAIYRVRRKGAPAGPKMARGPSGFPAPQATDRIWALTRIDGAGGADALRDARVALSNADAAVRQVAARSVGLHRDSGAATRLAELAVKDTPPIRREAATALGRIRSRAAVPALLESLKTSPDRFLEHALIFALIQIADRDATRKGLADADPAVVRGALIALDQMDGGGLKPEEATPYLGSASPVLQETALWIISRHADWGGSMTGFFRGWLAKEDLDEAHREELKRQLVAFSSDASIQDLISSALRDAKTAAAARVLLLEAVAEAPLRNLPRAWSEELDRALESRDDRVLRQAVATVRATPPDIRPSVTRVDSKVDFDGVVGKFAGTQLEEDFCVRWTGVIKVPRDGQYTFFTDSDDGSRLLLDGKLAVQNGDFHAMREKSGTADLKEGEHDIQIDLFQGGGDVGCKASWLAGGKKEIIPAGVLFHRVSTVRAGAGGGLEPGLFAEYFDLGESPRGFPDLAWIDHDPKLLAIARDSSRPEDLRVTALDAVAPRLEKVDAALFDFLASSMEGEKPPLLRVTAADALGKALLDDAQLITLANKISKAGALELPRLLGAFEKGTSKVVGKALFASLSSSPGLASLKQASLERLLKTYPEPVRRAAEPVLKTLEVDTEKQKARLAELRSVLENGDPQRGRELFFGKKAACSTCHAVGGQGGRIGPDLTKIGAIRTGQDFLESIVFPSSSFARGYEPYTVLTREGLAQSGIISRETAEAVYLTANATTTVRILRADLQSLEQAAVSIMPEGLDRQLTREELADLMTCLQSLK